MREYINLGERMGPVKMEVKGPGVDRGQEGKMYS